MTYDIVAYGHPALRKQAIPVERVSDELRQLAQDMLETMHAYNGIGLAAEQIARQKVDEIVLDQPASNAATNRMYRRLGFESVADALVVRLVPR